MSTYNLVHCSLYAGLRADAEHKPTGADLEVKSIGLLDYDRPTPLDGCSLFFLVTSKNVTEGTQRLAVSFSDGMTEEKVFPCSLKFGEPSEGLRRATAILPLSGLSVSATGTVVLRFLDADGVAFGEKSVPANTVRRNATAVFGAFIQDAQGIQNGERYLEARLPFMLATREGAFAGYSIVRISQRAGGNFEEDPLVLKLEPGFDRLKRAYGFTTAVHTAFKEYSGSFFAGTFSDNSSITMGNNVVIGQRAIDFELPELDASEAGW